MSDTNQISLARMFSGVVTISLLIAIATTPSIIVLLFSVFAMCLYAGCYCSMKRLKPWYSGAIVGYMFVAMLILNFVGTTVLKAEIVQGELYDEDGPFMVVIMAIVLFVGPGSAFAIVGASFWTILWAISKRSWARYEAKEAKNMERSVD